MTILLITLSVFVLYLIYERVVLDRLRKSIPLVITVTGTRGKSTVVRQLASILRESGKVVLAKSTGSQAQYVLPDGTVVGVARRGVVSILEQKKALRKAVMLKADCLVVEIMSIRPENHYVESQRILKPNIVVLTNVRRDHTEAMGEKEDEIAGVLQLDFPEGAEVYVPREHNKHLDPKTFQTRSLHLTVVPQTPVLSPADPDSALLRNEFSDNLNLVTAVARRFGIDHAVIIRGIRNAVHDIGRLKIWTLQAGGKRVFAVNAFAANDPDSTAKVLEKTREILAGKGGVYIGLLNLRADRPDRTVQWIDSLNSGMTNEFAQLYVLGGHANVVKRKIDTTRTLASKSPDTTTRMIVDGMEEDGVIFGFGNIGGAGERLVEYWQREGKEYGI
ncbi:MAG: poly-gamma-glutamate synthase PgsB [Ignavibacteriales bacterium]|nr:poly-gamma-glutamate synthase PgsB [Ignavibacteriales bacterium]